VLPANPDHRAEQVKCGLRNADIRRASEELAQREDSS
jgi:hypothetical protein